VYAIFLRTETTGNDVVVSAMYVHWLACTLIGLTLTASQGIAINHAVCCARNFVDIYFYLNISGKGQKPLICR